MTIKRITFIIALVLIILIIRPISQASLAENVDNPSIPEKYEGVYLEIIRSKNLLNVYLNGHVSYSFNVATGKEAKLTPEGSFRIVTKVKNPWYLPKNIPGGDQKNPLGTRWLGLNVSNTNGYKYGIHGTNNPNSIGHYVSSGCIRMHNKDVEWLYRHIPLQTPVIISN